MTKFKRVSRRGFLQTASLVSGGLIVTFACAPDQQPTPPTLSARVSETSVPAGFNTPGVATPVATDTSVPAPTAAPTAAAAQPTPVPPPQLDSWLRVSQDGRVILYTGKVEFGQGIRTGFGQLVAE